MILLNKLDKELKQQLITMYPDQIVLGLSVKSKVLYQKTFHQAKEFYGLSINQYMQDILGLEVKRKRRDHISELKLILEKEFGPTGTEIIGLSSENLELYRYIYAVAKNVYNMSIEDFLLEKLGYSYSNKNNSFIDTKTLAFIQRKFKKFNHATIYNHLGYSRQNYHSKIKTEINHTGKWMTTPLSEKIKKEFQIMINKNQDTYFDINNNKLYSILSDEKDNYYFLYIDFFVEGIFQQVEDLDIINQLNNQLYTKFERDEYLFFKRGHELYNPELRTQEYYMFMTDKKNVSLLDSFVARRSGSSKKAYIENILNLSFIKGNSISPIKMKEQLSNYIIKEPNYVYINTKDWVVYNNLVRKAKREFGKGKEITTADALNKLCEAYGYKYVYRNHIQI